MEKRSAWILNLDADLELAAGAAYSPKKNVIEAMRAHIGVLAAELLAPGDLLVADGNIAEISARGSNTGGHWNCEVGSSVEGRAFCPTPRALKGLLALGISPVKAPPFDVLRLVNSRAFVASMGQTLEGGEFVTSIDEAVRKLRTPPPFGDGWRVKRAFGMAGRGQRVIRQEDILTMIGFLKNGIAEGGVQIEPDVLIERELGLHGYLSESGSLTEGRVVEQICDQHGAWKGTVPLRKDDKAMQFATTLRGELQQVACALLAKGYFGPFGVDAFTFFSVRGALELQPRSEINARYSMGYALGMQIGRWAPSQARDGGDECKARR